MKNPDDFFRVYDEYCFFMNPKNGVSLFTLEEYQEFEYYSAEHEAEMDAERAWLRHAENQVDDGFEEWEWSRLYS